MKTLIFPKEDYEFIKTKYPELFTVLNKKAQKVGQNYVYIVKSNEEYDVPYFAFADAIMDSIGDTEDGLTSDGLRIESIWDYADSGDWS